MGRRASASLTGAGGEPRYGVVTCYSMQMFIFLLFVGMVLSGSYPLVRPAHAAPAPASAAGLPSFRARHCGAVPFRALRSCDDRPYVQTLPCTPSSRLAQRSAVPRCAPRVLQHAAGRRPPAPPPEQHYRSAGAPVQSPGGSLVRGAVTHTCPAARGRPESTRAPRRCARGSCWT